jgi:hypothetical protein
MDKKAIATVNLIFIILFAVALAIGTAIIGSVKNNAAQYADQSAKELARIINLARPNQTITFDIQKATEVAAENQVNFEKIFTFNNPENQICVQLSPETKNCYNYFNDIDVIFIDRKIIPPNNILILETREKQKNEA